jgi:hypothetical protein
MPFDKNKSLLKKEQHGHDAFGQLVVMADPSAGETSCPKVVGDVFVEGGVKKIAL